jgi:Uma2 family endonuclease
MMPPLLPDEARALDAAAPVPLEFYDGRLRFHGAELPAGARAGPGELERALRAMTGGSPRHGELVVGVLAALRAACRAGSGGCKTVTEVRVSLPDGRWVYPDAVVVCGGPVPPAHDPLGLVNPTVVVEVLSPSTEAVDRGEKFERLQALDALQHYVLVHQARARVEVYSRAGEAWVLRVAGPGGAARLDALGAELPLDELYAGVELDPVDAA